MPLRSREPPPPLYVTIDQLVLAYWKFVKSYYVKNGKPTSEQDTIRQALRFVRKTLWPHPSQYLQPVGFEGRPAGHDRAPNYLTK